LAIAVPVVDGLYDTDELSLGQQEVASDDEIGAWVGAGAIRTLIGR
jgi:hypothetical protein